MRRAEVERKTRETDIRLWLELDGDGSADVETGIGFFNHMLGAFARFAHARLYVRCEGDLHVDGHHTVEDVGICLGQALAQALGDKAGIARLGHAYVPMDEALAFAALDFSARPFLSYSAPQAQGMIGQFDAALTEEFLRALAVHAGITLHVRMDAGHNAHHCVEAMFKALGSAVDRAKRIDDRIDGVLSTKGVL